MARPTRADAAGCVELPCELRYRGAVGLDGRVCRDRDGVDGAVEFGGRCGELIQDQLAVGVGCRRDQVPKRCAHRRQPHRVGLGDGVQAAGGDRGQMARQLLDLVEQRRRPDLPGRSPVRRRRALATMATMTTMTAMTSTQGHHTVPSVAVVVGGHGARRRRVWRGGLHGLGLGRCGLGRCGLRRWLLGRLCVRWRRAGVGFRRKRLPDNRSIRWDRRSGTAAVTRPTGREKYDQRRRGRAGEVASRHRTQTRRPARLQCRDGPPASERRFASARQPPPCGWLGSRRVARTSTP